MDSGVLSAATGGTVLTFLVSVMLTCPIPPGPIRLPPINPSKNKPINVLQGEEERCALALPSHLLLPVSTRLGEAGCVSIGGEAIHLIK